MSHNNFNVPPSVEGSEKKVEQSLLVGLLLSAVGLLLGRLLIKPRSDTNKKEVAQKPFSARATTQPNHVEKGIMLWENEPTWTQPTPVSTVQTSPSQYVTAENFFQQPILPANNDMLLLPPTDAELQRLGYPASVSGGGSSAIGASAGGYMNGLPWQNQTIGQPDVAVEPTTSWKAIAHEFFETIVLTLVIFVLMRALIQNYRIEGYSMEPNLHEQQYLIVNKVAYYLGEPKRGDIIVFEYPKGDPNGPERDYIKRIIGLPGDTVECRPNEIIVNGEVIDEPYKPNPWRYSCSPTTLGIDEYYVLGDNRPQSSDSHQWGSLERKYIIGKAWLSYWPYDYWGWVPNYPIEAPAPEPPVAEVP